MSQRRPDYDAMRAQQARAQESIVTALAWHADDCGGTCDGCGHIAADGFWYNAPCPDALLQHQLDWAENGVPDAVRA